jgi:hypothetical protein
MVAYFSFYYGTTTVGTSPASSCDDTRTDAFSLYETYILQGDGKGRPQGIFNSEFTGPDPEELEDVFIEFTAPDYSDAPPFMPSIRKGGVYIVQPEIKRKLMFSISGRLLQVGRNKRKGN